MKIVVLDGYTENPGDLSWDALSKLGELTVYDRSAPETVAERMRGAEIVLTNKTVLNRAVIENAAALRYIGVLATGYNIVDISAAADRGIPVCNIPAYSTNSVAQMVFALLLEICQQVGYHSNAVHEGKWTACPDFCFWDRPLLELAGKTMGIIGYGRIGKRVGEIARCFGMNVIAWTRTPKDPECVTLDELLARSDVISLHCPLFEETRELISRKNIEKMKDGVIIINTSRGPLVNETDLADALQTGKVAAAGVDVAGTEPLPADCALLTAPNCFITPHIAWATREARERLMDIAVENVKAFIEGYTQNRVN